MSKRILVGAAALTATLALAPSAIAADFTFGNPTPITINDAITPDVPVPATPYPSIVSVPQMGFTPSPSQSFAPGSTATPRATVTLHNVSHPSPADIKMTLINAVGQTVLLENVGGTTTPVSNATLTFSSSTSTYAWFGGQLASGVYRPSAYSITGQNQMSSMEPLRYAAGLWSVYVADQDPEDTGVIAGGISVSFTGTLANRVSFGAAKPDKRSGTAQLAVTVPNPGVIKLMDTKTVKGLTLPAPAAGVYQLTIASKGKALTRLKRKRRVSVTALVGFTPTHGVVNSTYEHVDLKLKPKKKAKKKRRK